MIDPSRLTSDAIRSALLSRGDEQAALFEQARATRHRLLGDRVLVRGVLEISNDCGKDCGYCAMRRSNANLSRYVMTVDQIMELAKCVADAGITWFFLQAAQHPEVDRLVEEVIPRVKREFGMNVLLCLGERTKAQFARFAELGADSYIIKFETSDPELYSSIGCGSHKSRLQAGEYVREAGMKLGSGNIVGLPGQTIETLVRDVELGIKVRPDYISAAPFIPNDGTPCANEGAGDVEATLNTMALWRIALGSPLIPAVSALQRMDKEGQYRGLQAGANVITVNFTPTSFRDRYCIYNKGRFIVSVEHAISIIRRAGLEPILSGPRSH
jgi:biotin synthase